MIATIVNVYVKPEFVDDFIKISTENHLGSVKEPGNLRFDVIQNIEDPTRFVLYEAYESEEAAASHKTTPHYLKWRETVANWMVKPREGIKHSIICID
jgi:autoinducer 2-degrading protein